MSWRRVILGVVVVVVGLTGWLVLPSEGPPKPILATGQPAVGSGAVPGAEVLPPNLQEIIGRVVNGPLCEAPPATFPPEIQAIIDKGVAEALATIPPSVTAPGPGGVANIHHQLVPC